MTWGRSRSVKRGADAEWDAGLYGRCGGDIRCECGEKRECVEKMQVQSGEDVCVEQVERGARRV